MTQGFYEQLGVGTAASVEDIRAAYQRLVTAQIRRRKRIVDEGGDTEGLDLARAQADEAWAVLSDQARRRQYDAMLVLGEEPIADAHELWDKASGALVSPAAGAAAELLRVSTNLSVGALPSSARPSGAAEVQEHGEAPIALGARASEPDQSSVETRVPDATEFPSEPDSTPSAGFYELPTSSDTRNFRVVDGTPEASAVLVLPTGAPRDAVVATEDILRMVEEHGYTGALLCSVREARKISLQDMSDTTRISARYLEAIESDQYDVLPSATFVRGYIREMSRMLGMDVDQVVAGYMARYGR